MSKFKEQYKAIFGEDYVEEKYKFKPHNFNAGKKAGGKPYCAICGLVGLNNEFTRWSIKMGCFSDLHPQYKNQRAKAKTI